MVPAEGENYTYLVPRKYAMGGRGLSTERW